MLSQLQRLKKMVYYEIQEIFRRCYDPVEHALRINENSNPSTYSELEFQDILNDVYDEETDSLRVVL